MMLSKKFSLDLDFIDNNNLLTPLAGAFVQNNKDMATYLVREVHILTLIDLQILSFTKETYLMGLHGLLFYTSVRAILLFSSIAPIRLWMSKLAGFDYENVCPCHKNVTSKTSFLQLNASVDFVPTPRILDRFPTVLSMAIPYNRKDWVRFLVLELGDGLSFVEVDGQRVRYMHDFIVDSVQ